MRISSGSEWDGEEPDFRSGSSLNTGGQSHSDPNNRIETYLENQTSVHNRLQPFFDEQRRKQRQVVANEYRLMSNTLEAWRLDFELAAVGEIPLSEEIFDRAVQYWNRMCEIVVDQRRNGRLSDDRRYERLDGMHSLLHRVQSAQDYTYIRKLQFDDNF